MRYPAPAALAVLALAFTSCVTSPPRRSVMGFAMQVEPAHVAVPLVDSVILVTLDGTRWQEVFLGADRALANAADVDRTASEIMPTLHRWMTVDGVGLGAPHHGEVWASGPNYVSLPGYTEILTGRPSACLSNECGHITTPTLVDQVASAGSEAAVISSWELIERVAAIEPRAPHVTFSVGRHGTGRTDGLDEALLAEGKSQPAWPGVDDYRPDAYTAKTALGFFDKHLPRFTFVGLGDTDEHAHHGDYARYLQSMRDADAFLTELERRVTERTVIIVTADHGRSAAFRDHGGGWHESGRVWMVARGPCLSPRGLLDLPVLHLADIAPTVRCLLGMAPDAGRDAGHSIAPLCASTE